ncbi:dynein axonemal light chain 4-like isoform X3 [Schistocerca gregaria]|uniref:dynein axonemal light chain 4-like isoform X3 n=1 Tax=Schistocerca gregaria TaxID=7010 RepID=UPI00211EC208|nr:dynein axonemal light chain 4-like isoform X3 [Schistocerca gregaria]
MSESEGKKEEAETKKIIHTYPLVRHCDMIDEMRGEAMELCVTACEKHAANNEFFFRVSLCNFLQSDCSDESFLSTRALSHSLLSSQQQYGCSHD